MKILHAFTRRSLMANKIRTLVTVIGIILSMALLTAVIEGAYSGQQYLVKAEEETAGQWHVSCRDLDEQEAQELSSLSDIERTAVIHEAGWAKVESINEYKPYLLVESFDPKDAQFLAVRLKSGRLPENENEIVLPEHLYTNGGVAVTVGSTITLDLGERQTLDGYPLTFANPFQPDEEQIVNTRKAEYLVTGICYRMISNTEYYSCPGYMAFICGSEDGPLRVFARLKNPGKAEEWVSKHDLSDRIDLNQDLLRFNGSFFNRNFTTVLYRFAAILILLVCFGSVSMIYNSFSISVSERTKQFGILKSIGATKKQIRGSVLYEALVLAGIAIPIGLVIGCLGIGITLYVLRDSFALFFDVGTNTRMQLVLNPWALACAVVLCLLTTLISAYVPALRAMRIPPIDAIRQSRDIKARHVKTSKLVTRLFGFEGTMSVRNFKRSRKAYRSTILSLFASIVLFVSVSSFCDYLTFTARVEADSSGRVDLVVLSRERLKDKDAMEKLIDSISEVESRLYMEDFGMNLITDRQYLTADGAEQSERYDGYYHPECGITFIEDEEFRRLCRENVIDADYMIENRLGLVWNTVVARFSDENGNLKRKLVSVFEENSLPATLKRIKGKPMEGYYFDRAVTDENGEMLLVYYPIVGADEVDYDAPYTIPADGDLIIDEFAVGAVIRSPLSAMPQNSFTVYYPLSLRDELVGEDEPQSVMFSMTATAHARAFTALTEALREQNAGRAEVYDLAENEESVRMAVTVINVFSYGFIVMMSLIALTNVFNTVSTNMMLRRREFAMLKSIGLSEKGFRKMLDYECLIYGCRSLLLGLPVSVLVSYAIYRATYNVVESSFYIPWYSIVIAVISVFLVVGIAMVYTASILHRDNPIDALKNENL